MSLVLVDDLDAWLGPTEVFRMAGQVVLARGACGIDPHLDGARLPDVDQGVAVEMLGPDLGGTVS